MRYYQGKPIELLAPAGNFEILKSIVTTSCDAVYFGGQVFNMRLIRKGFNFSHEELIEATRLLHENNKLAYITVNNLINEQDLLELDAYLVFLDQKVKPDGIIVQDMGIISRIQELGLTLDIHASVMMNVHNLAMIEQLKAYGIKRVVLSREASLDSVQKIKARTDIEIEYFTHGDMCIAHGSQCYYSSHIFGMSSNQGRCLKPCRWWFSSSINADTENKEKEFPMAVKDLSLIEHLSAMIIAGVTSFKIEGRMREKEYITQLVQLYGDALDHLITTNIVDMMQNLGTVDVTGNTGNNVLEMEQGVEASKENIIATRKAANWIFDNRKRDLSTGYAYGKPGMNNINKRYEGSGKIYSTGKMFSTPTAELPIDAIWTGEIRKKLANYLAKDENVRTLNNKELTKTLFSVRVQTMAQAVIAIKARVGRIYVAMDVFQPIPLWTRDKINALRDMIETQQSNQKIQKTQLFIATPRMSIDSIVSGSREFVESIRDLIDGVLVTHLGEIAVLKELELPMIGDYSLNVCNSAAIGFYKSEGLVGVTSSIELKADGLGALLKASKTSTTNIEIIAFGRLPVMYYDHEFASNRLYNEAGTYDLKKDCYGRTHLLSQRNLCLSPFFSELQQFGDVTFRIEAGEMSDESLRDFLKNGEPEEITQCTYGALRF